MTKKTGIIIGIVAAALAITGAVLAVNLGGSGSAGGAGADEPDLADTYERSYIKSLSEQIDFSAIDPHQIYAEGRPESGNLPDNIKGNPDAPIIIYEYADYQCTHCAEWNEVLNEVVEGMGETIAVVMRSYVLSYNAKGVQAAAAAEAAALQGFWADYKDLLFENQADWYYASADKFQELLEKYFKQVAGGSGNLNQFRSDMQSAAVKQKLAFDMGLGTKVALRGTPAFYIDGEFVEPSDLKDTLIAKLAEISE